MRQSLLFSILAVFFCFTLPAQDAKTLYNEGLQLKADSKSAAAAEKFKKAVELSRAYTEARYEWAWCQNDLKDYNGALSNLYEVKRSWPDIPKVYFEMGYALDKLGKYDSAIIVYNKCLSLKPDYYSVYRQLGYVEYSRDNYREALAQFKKFIVLSKDEIKDYLFWYRKGYSENAEKDFGSAKTSLLNSLKYKTDHNNTYLELGFAATKLKEADEAIDWFKKSIDLDPKSHIPYNGIGEVYRDIKKDMDMAMSWYQKTLNLNINERKGNFGMGYCLNSKQKFAEAIPYLKRAIENEPTYTAAFVELGYSYFKTGNHTDAISHLNKAISMNPLNENARYYLCLLYVDRKEKSKAQQMVDELRKMNSRHTETLQAKVNTIL